jgi:hypothetical protein
MSTEITARLYFDSEPAPARLFTQLVEAVAAWGDGNAPWQGLRVSGPRRAVIHRDDQPLETAALVAAAAPLGGPSQQIASRISYRCWRFRGQTAELGSSVAWLEAWDDGYGQVQGEDVRRVWGSAAFTIADCGPYCALLDASDAAAKINERVEENLERFTRLIFGIVEAVQPAALKVFTDQGAYLPFNAHLAYYASEARVLEDMRLIADVWQRGLPGHQLPPLAEISDAKSIAFHWWRNDEQRRRLWTSLASWVPRAGEITAEDVQRAVASGEFDTYSAPRGFIVLDFPHFVNAFLDRFFLTTIGRPA